MFVWDFDGKEDVARYMKMINSVSFFGNIVPDDTWNKLKEEFQRLQGDEAWTLPNFQAALKDLKNQASM